MVNRKRIVMEYISIISQIVIALGIFNVWLLRYGSSTRYRGGNATDMKSEFAAYGLPPWSVNVVGGIKMLTAAFLLLGIAYPVLVIPAAVAMIVLMASAMVMHIRIGDPLYKSLPAISLLLLAIVPLLF